MKTALAWLTGLGLDFGFMTINYSKDTYPWYTWLMLSLAIISVVIAGYSTLECLEKRYGQ